MKSTKVLTVKFRDRTVGTLAMTKDRRIAFSYHESWISDGFSISPFSLPLRDGVFIAEKTHFHGLFGVFGDSLPDAWGTLLVDRLLQKNGIPLHEVNVLDRLAFVGASGIGALRYEPEISLTKEIGDVDLDQIAQDCQKLLASEQCENLDMLYRLGGSSGGARPKVTIEKDGKIFLVKFPAHVDSAEVGLMEYEYARCAESCGIQMPETRLFPSRKGPGYFGIERFDQENGKKKHTMTAAALLEADYESPCLDYHTLMKLTKIVSRNQPDQLLELYRRMCFNVWAHNCDDHAKNFSYLYDEENDCFQLSPAYDLTYSNTYFGEHTTSIDGNGRNPSMKEMVAVGIAAGLSKKVCTEIAEEIRQKVETDLRKWICGR